MPAMKTKPTPGRPILDPGRTTPLATWFNFKVTPHYREWLHALSRHTKMPVSTMIREALGHFAKAHGYKIKPPLM